MRFATATIVHECNFFLPLKADLEHFRRNRLLFGDEVTDFFRGTKTCVGGFIDASERLGFELVPTVYADASAYGVITKEAYDFVLGKILEGVRGAGKIDGLLLFTHGAGYTEEHPDMEGHYLRALREVVGPDIPMVSTFDWHANHTEEWHRHLDIPVGYDTYPHVDGYERALEAADLIVGMVEGEVKPTRAFVKPPMILNAQAQFTGRYPISALMERTHEYEKSGEALTITVAGGFPWCDVPTPTLSITVTTNDDPEKAREIAEDLRSFIWSRRADLLVKPVPVRDAVRMAMEAEEGPMVLADIANNPGWGAAADGTVLLKALVEMGAENAVLGALWDADGAAVAEAVEAGVGSEVTLRVGGKVDKMHGPPLEVTGRVKLIHDGRFVHRGPMSAGVEMDMGRTVVLDLDGVLLVLTEKRYQPNDLQFYRCLGIEPTEKQILCVFSSVHYRAAHGPIAKEIIEVDTPGISSPRLAGYPWKNLKRPVFPLDVETLGIVELKTMEEE